MPTLSIISSSPKSGKTATAVALGLHYQQQGQRVAWLKPVSMTVVEEDGAPVDRDAQFVRETLKLPETAARGPVPGITPGLLGEKLDEVLWAREPRGRVPGTGGTLGTRRNS